MKRTVGIVAGLAALGMVAYIGSKLGAQAPAGATPAPAQTRVAIVNLLNIVKNYNKAKFYDGEMEEARKPYMNKMEKLKTDLLQWQNYLGDPKNVPQINDEQRAAGERSIITIKRQLEDLQKEANKALGKRREQQVVQLYREIEEAVKRYAAANGFHLVLSYFEPVNPTDVFSGPNINRKLEGMQAGGTCNPMYYADGLDISMQVVEGLNRAYTGSTVATPGAKQ